MFVCKDFFDNGLFFKRKKYPYFLINYNFYLNLAYSCPNYLVKSYLVKTNKPSSAEVRGPDVMPVICIAEQVMEHVAAYLNKDPLEIRMLNLYKQGDCTPGGHSLPYFELEKVLNKLKESSKYLERRQEIEEFNKVNRFKKRGIALMPLLYPLTHSLGYYNALVTIKHHDGSVAICHGGIEMGQGLIIYKITFFIN